jgi:peroxiredoxin
MHKEKEQPALGRLIIIFAIMLAVMIICTGCKKKAVEPGHIERSSPEPVQSEPVAKPAQPESASQTTSEPAKTDIKPTPAPVFRQEDAGAVSLNDIISSARTWGPAYKSWYGKPAPDFTLADLAGKEHKLSDYRGKDVLLVFWATWCPPCRMEIPGLIELRKTVSENNLAILAISDEEANKVKKFADEAKINYTVLIDPHILPGPYNSINSIPCSFFINAEGKIKLATTGLISLGEIKAILQAP